MSARMKKFGLRNIIRRLDTFLDAFKGNGDIRQCHFTRVEGQVGQVDVDRQARKVPVKKIDSRPALEGKDLFLCDEGQYV